MRFRSPLHTLQINAFFRHLVEWRKFAQTLHGFDDAVGNVIDFSLGVEASDAEADGAVRQIVSGAEGFQNLTWLKRCGGACRST